MDAHNVDAGGVAGREQQQAVRMRQMMHRIVEYSSMHAPHSAHDVASMRRHLRACVVVEAGAAVAGSRGRHLIRSYPVSGERPSALISNRSIVDPRRGSCRLWGDAPPL